MFDIVLDISFCSFFFGLPLMRLGLGSCFVFVLVSLSSPVQVGKFLVLIVFMCLVVSF